MNNLDRRKAKVHLLDDLDRIFKSGPLLFIIYINDLKFVSEMFNLIMYADDSNLSSTLKCFATKQAATLAGTLRQN